MVFDWEIDQSGFCKVTWPEQSWYAQNIKTIEDFLAFKYIKDFFGIKAIEDFLAYKRFFSIKAIEDFLS
ncbi:hypothetical protein DICPUDRAFT_159155 [Dictyostelium purpureum]|uniref:Uncharacterized protein n=1 Tax=Dictyostelium purpureum TaxID=5786 RepID=F1A3F0_DICPU|nr:uncharacterized protein DICPUDRAFT_159155 [Dictyostelium purpureum]EGC29283.1 hypothetical protein DICPUDRAFT_159155 [Dictyostelium purpureum]|eukprot:XP_003294193.1 hypothetical protein DICPUDRAFT_159155 [Dictyostelium purpureum]